MLPERYPEPCVYLRVQWPARGGRVLEASDKDQRLSEEPVREPGGFVDVQHGGNEEDCDSGVCIQEGHWGHEGDTSNWCVQRATWRQGTLEHLWSAGDWGADSEGFVDEQVWLGSPHSPAAN